MLARYWKEGHFLYTSPGDPKPASNSAVFHKRFPCCHRTYYNRNMTSTLVAGFGSVVADVLMLADAVSLGHKNHVAHQEIQVGGVVPTALIVLSRPGCNATHTAIGDDLFGDALLAIFKRKRRTGNNREREKTGRHLPLW